jgi:hypothetical protein
MGKFVEVAKKVAKKSEIPETDLGSVNEIAA